MITLTIILVALVLALAFFVFFKLLKTVFKAVFAVLLLVLFVLLIFGLVIYIDFTKLKGNFDENQTILLSHNGNVVAGFLYSNNKDTEVLASDKLNLLSKEEISQINEDIENNDYKKDSDTGLSLVIDSSYFIGKSIELMEGKSIVVNETFLDAVLSCTKLSSCTAPIITAVPEIKKQIDSSFEDEQDVKNKLFFNLFVQETKETKGAFLITGIKENTISIYPELLTMKLIKIIPDKIIDNALKKRLERNLDAEAMNSTIDE